MFSKLLKLGRQLNAAFRVTSWSWLFQTGWRGNLERKMPPSEDWCKECHPDLPTHNHQHDGSCRVLHVNGTVLGSPHSFAGYAEELEAPRNFQVEHWHQMGPYLGTRVPIGTLFGILGPYWVSIYFSGSLFSVFWLHSREECQFSLHVYNKELSWSVCDE